MGFPDRIYLTGFMASGKSTVGPILAQALRYRFVDLDEAIVAHVGKSIPRIFEEEGETVFRSYERAVLRNVGAGSGIVVATGGGALASEAAIRLARSNGAVVYLDASAATIVERVRGAATDRPLLAEDAEQTVRSLLETRRRYYEQAHLRINVDGRTPEDIAEEIRRRLNG